MKILDEDIGGAGHLYEMTWVGYLCGHIVRIQVKRNHYANQSFATASLLNDHEDWTLLTTIHHDRWWKETSSIFPDTEENIRKQLTPVMERLEAGATTVLDAL